MTRGQSSNVRRILEEEKHSVSFSRKVWTLLRKIVTQLTLIHDITTDFRKMPEDFDVSKESEVEGLSDADFSGSLCFRQPDLV